MAQAGGAHRAVRHKREHEDHADGKSRHCRDSRSDLWDEVQGEAWGQILNNTHRVTPIRQDEAEKFILKQRKGVPTFEWDFRVVTLTQQALYIGLEADDLGVADAIELLSISNVSPADVNEDSLKSELMGESRGASIPTSPSKASFNAQNYNSAILFGRSDQRQVISSTLEGTIWRKGQSKRSFEKCFVILCEGHMYWSKQKCSDALTSEDLRKARQGSTKFFRGWANCSGIKIKIGDQPHNRFCFSVTASEGSKPKTMDLACDTERERDQWISSLQTLAGSSDEVEGTYLRLDVHERNRSQFLRFKTSETRDNWLKDIRRAVRDEQIERDRKLYPTFLSRLRAQAGTLYNSDGFQKFVGFMLIANFVINIAEAEFGDSASLVFEAIDILFTILYVLELSLNLFVNWWKPFLEDGWSIFDTICVIVGLVGTFIGVSSAKIVRSIRILRIVRVLRRFKNLQAIVVAISRCMLPLLNACVIVLVVNVIYAVMAAELFAPYSHDLFGSFSKSVQTMFQVGSGDGWMTDVVRPLQEASREDSTPDVDGAEAMIALFFISYILLVYIVLTNVMVSVLLEGFISAFEEMQGIEKAEESTEEYKKIAHKLDPLMASFASYTSPDHLRTMIERLFLHIDVDRSGGINFKEFSDAVSRLPYEPRIQYFALEDWDAFTKGHTFVDEEGELDREAFEQCILLELHRFSNRMIAHQMNESVRENATDSTLYLALKICLMQLQKLSDKFSASSPCTSDDEVSQLKSSDKVSASSPCTSDDEVSQLKKAVAEQQSTIQRQNETLDDLCGRVTGVQERVDEMRGLMQFLAEQQGYGGTKSSAESAYNYVAFLSSPRQCEKQNSQSPVLVSGRSALPPTYRYLTSDPRSARCDVDYTSRRTQQSTAHSTAEPPPPPLVLRPNSPKTNGEANGHGSAGLLGELGLQYPGHFEPIISGRPEKEGFSLLPPEQSGAPGSA